MNHRADGGVGGRAQEREEVEGALRVGEGADEFELNVPNGFCDRRQVDNEERIAAGAGEKPVSFIPVDVVNAGELDGFGGDGDGALGPTQEGAGSGKAYAKEGESEGFHEKREGAERATEWRYSEGARGYAGESQGCAEAPMWRVPVLAS